MNRGRVLVTNTYGKICVRKLHIENSQIESKVVPKDVSDAVRSIPVLDGAGPFAQETTFKALGTPATLLNVSLPASSVLYSRRGTIIGINGSLDDITSHTAFLNPLKRFPLGIPFMYQKITSTTPLSALVASNSSALSTFTVLSLNGRADWTITQRNALQAWSGVSLTATPIINTKANFTNWGNTLLSGRGTAALLGEGQIYQIVLKESESFVVTAQNLLAFSIADGNKSPSIYNFHHIPIRWRTPILSFKKFLPQNLSSYINTIKKNNIYISISNIFSSTLEFFRRIVLGENRFIRIKGPSTVLIQSRASHISDAFSKSDITKTLKLAPRAINITESSLKSDIPKGNHVPPPPESADEKVRGLKVFTIEENGKSKLESTKSFKNLIN